MSALSLPDGLVVLIKTATRELVLACAAPGSTGPQRVAQMTGYSQGEISRWQGDSYSAIIPLEVVGQLEAAIGRPIVSRLLASLTGHRLEPIATEEPNETPDAIIFALMRQNGSHAKFQQTGMQALDDGKLTPGEAKDMLAQLLRHQDESSALAARLAAHAGIP